MPCQVCGRPAVDGDGEERHLFLMREAGRPIGEGETTRPPVCVPCARVPVEACPHLRRGYVAAWVGYVPAWGAGVLHHPVALEPAVEEPGLIPYGSPDARRTVATRQVVSPHEVEPVGPAELPAPR
ncbi:hypothetical protein [Streptomyces sp. SS8]